MGGGGAGGHCLCRSSSRSQQTAVPEQLVGQLPARWTGMEKNKDLEAVKRLLHQTGL